MVKILEEMAVYTVSRLMEEAIVGTEHFLVRLVLVGRQDQTLIHVPHRADEGRGDSRRGLIVLPENVQAGVSALVEDCWIPLDNEHVGRHASRVSCEVS